MSSIPQDLNPGSWDTSLDFYCLARDKESSFCILGEILQVFNSHTALQMEFTSTHLQWLQQAFLVLKILFVTQASLEGTHSIHLQEALPSICLQDCRINKTPRRERVEEIKLLILSPKVETHFDKRSHPPTLSPAVRC